MRTKTVTPVTVAVLFCALPALAKEYRAESYKVTLHVDQQGVLAVTEAVVFHFEGGPFTYVFRDISAKNTDGITGVSAWMDGHPLAPGVNPGEAEIEGTSPVRVRWHFAPLTDESHLFTVRYLARGALRPSGGVQLLRWRVVPQERGYHIDSGDVTLEYPAGASPLRARLNNGGQLEIGEDRALARLPAMRAREDVVLTAEFPGGSFSSGVPAWQAESDRRGREFLGGLRFGALIAVIFGGLGCWWIFRARGPQPQAPAMAKDFMLSEPPSALAPVLAASLLGKPGIIAGILHELARRGVIEVEESEPGVMGSHRFTVVLADVNAPLAPYERVFVDSVFRDGDTSISMSGLRSRAIARAGRVKAAITRELEAEGLVDASRAGIRLKLMLAGAIAFGAGLVLFLLGVLPRDSSVAGVAAATGAAAVITGFIALIVGGTVSRWTDAGAFAAAQWRAFARYLSAIRRGRSPLAPPEAMERLFPYAAAFGTGASLLKRQQKEREIVLPNWFHTVPRHDGSDASAFVSFVSASDSTVSGAGADAGGAAGASGGGASGAG